MKSSKGGGKLFGGSPSQTEGKLYYGFSVYIGQLCKSASGNKYFDIKLKFGENDYLSVRVMNYGGEVELYAEKRGKPVAITVNKSGNTTFYNKKYNNKLEDILYDVDFGFTLPKTPLNSDFTKISLLIVVEVMLKWIAEEKETTNGYCVRETVLKY